MTFYRYGGFWRRLCAYTIDGTIILFIYIFLVIIAALAFFFGAADANNKDFLAGLTDPASVSPIMLLIWISLIVLDIAYFTYFHGATGRTPGKMLFSLQVVSDDGAPISFGTAFLRAVGYFVSNIFYLGFIWVAFDKRKQGWHDKIAGTVVIIKEKGEQTGITIPDNSPPGPTAETAKPPENNNNYTEHS
jgi:uncharacterized RDD family membrane protein YckC